MQESDPATIVDAIRVHDWPTGRSHNLQVDMVRDGTGSMIRVPAVVVRGAEPGPVLGVTAAIHGNELNGIQVIHKLLQGLNPETLRGTVIAVPIVNVPGFLIQKREFNDGSDLNRIMPGKADGTCGQQYAHRLLERVIAPMDTLIDLHTASFGRVNSLYVRADLLHEKTSWMATTQHASILVHNCGADGTLRSAAVRKGIAAITVEVGDPQVLQESMIKPGLAGAKNIMIRLGMIDGEVEAPPAEHVVCVKSYWLYTDIGGILEVPLELAQTIKKGDLIGRVTDVYGKVLKEYFCPEDAVVVGKSTNPVNQAGSRIVHLGIPGGPSEMASCPL